MKKDKITPQLEIWKSSFGKNYTDRNIYSMTELDRFYNKQYGVSRTSMNDEFLSPVKKNIRNVLEIGANCGNQLVALQLMGFDRLYGIEFQEYPIEKAKNLTTGLDIIQGSALDIPFKNAYFDLVFTSGLLIHISPQNINKALDEIYRCAKKYIWGFEYFSNDYSEIVYRGNSNLLWKANFCKLYLDRFKDLRLVKEKQYKYIDNDNIDSMFLLEKIN